MAKARGFRGPPRGGVRGSFRPRQRACSWPHSHHGHALTHNQHTATALPTSPHSQSDRTGSHMLSRSWWRTGKGLRGTAYRLQCTCRRASHEAERVPHWQRLSLSRLNHWLPRGETHPEIMEGTAECHQEITDAGPPQPD